MTQVSISLPHLNGLTSADGVHELFRRLGYDVYDPQPFEGAALDDLELDAADRENILRAYIVAGRDSHTVFLYEVRDLRSTRLRALAYNLLERGTGLLIVTRDYREILFVDSRFAGKPSRSSVRVNKLKLISGEPTRHDLDTLNAIHAHQRSGAQIYEAQAAAFNVTTVTKRFYEDYRGHYERAKAAIQQANPGIRDFYDADKLHAFTQRLLGRLMFLYFLQRKGWLGGRPRFLTEQYALTQRLHAGEIDSGSSHYYYRDVLEPLFFQTMNTRRPGDLTQWEGIRIPYLNGGLFDEARDPAGPILIPDALFDPNDVNGLLGFFNRYNFTIANDTPLEQDVAVDPEMLGKVFENLLEERDRGQSGSFYTPRPIVAYMCQEALVGYLEESAEIPRETTRALFDPDVEAELTLEQAERASAALDTLTVLDPAVGSGSFLIGMMNEIIRLRRACFAALHPQAEPAAEQISNWKEAIIRDTLYGVDIKPEAIEIAQLRLWLALVVDQTIDQARPLPNLDYKLMAGNSLIETIDGEPVLTENAAAMLGDAVPPTQYGLGFFETDRERLSLDALRREYFSASPEERRRLKPDILAQERLIVTTALREKAAAAQATIDNLGRAAALNRGALNPRDKRRLEAATNRLKHLDALQEDIGKPDYVPPFFLYRLHFSEVFERKGGFDIVVANPPYVRGELLGVQKAEFKVTPIYADVYAGSADLYVYFYARGYHLLKPGGQLAYITSNKYLRAKYGTGLRRFLAGQVAMRAIIDFGDLPVFDAAAYPCIIIGSRAVPEEFIPAAAVTQIDGMEDLNTALANGVMLNSSELGASEWQISDSDTQRVFAKLKAAGTPLGEYVNGQIYYGIKTGLNEAFVIDEAKRAELIAADPRSVEVLKPWLRGRDVKRWQVEPAGLYLIGVQNSGDADANNPWALANTELEARLIFSEVYPAIHDHLTQFEEALRVRQDQGRWWWELRACAYYKEFEKGKIAFPNICSRPEFTFDDEKFYINQKAFIASIRDEFLLGVLNSSTMFFLFWQLIPRLQNDYFEPGYAYTRQIPIPNPPADLREQIAALARACLDAAKDQPDRLPALEAELNALVYQAYGLDEDDIRVIEGTVGAKPAASADAVSYEPSEDDEP